MKSIDKQWTTICKVGGFATVLVLVGILTDMVMGSITDGDTTSLPQNAVDKFYQFQESRVMGLYTMDLLNVIIQLIMIPSIFALYAAHRNSFQSLAFLSLVLFIVGTILFVAGNTALTMLELSDKYFAASSEEQKMLLAAAGEAMLAKGAHGSLSVFIGFALPAFANILMSWVMIRGKVFGKFTAWFGFIGNCLMLLYVILVTFIPGVDKMAMAFAMPGGLLVMLWMILYGMKLFRIKLHY